MLAGSLNGDYKSKDVIEGHGCSDSHRFGSSILYFYKGIVFVHPQRNGLHAQSATAPVKLLLLATFRSVDKADNDNVCRKGSLRRI